jgi:hypothetical protein
MIFSEIYQDVVSSFGSLWRTKVRGATLEIITPFTTTSNKFVSVFLSKQNDQFVVSDGGWIGDGGYGTDFDRDVDCFRKIIHHYKGAFDVKETLSDQGMVFFYKKTVRETAVPSLILDMTNFISSLVSLSDVEFENEKIERELFRRTASEFLSEVFTPDKLLIGDFLDSNKEIKPSAIIKKDNGKVLLCNYVTGSTPNYFKSSISKTNLIFELALKSHYNSVIERNIALVDDSSDGYVPSKISIWLNHLIDNTNSVKVNWSSKEQLYEFR